MTLTIVGLGPGNPALITREAWQMLADASTVLIWSAEHVNAADLPAGPTYVWLEETLAGISDSDALLDVVADTVCGYAEDVVYAVPGHPHIANASVKRVLNLAESRGIACRVVAGISPVDAASLALGFDAGQGMQVLSAARLAGMYHPPVNPDSPVFLLVDGMTGGAAGFKRALLNQYPASHPIVFVHSPGTSRERIEELTLASLDDSAPLDRATVAYLKPVSRLGSFESLQETMAHLRSPEGCPWDREQTHESLRPYLLEEAYEVLDALDNGDVHALREELGDLLLQIVFHAQVAADAGAFTMADVIHAINSKLIHRHPHVWGDVSVNSSEDVTRNWEAIKKQERQENGNAKASLLDGVAKALPALAQAFKYQERAARVGFDWDEIMPVVDKIAEEIREIHDARTEAERAAEIGDLLFALVNWIRWLEVDPETALREANQRFYRRFHYIELAADQAGRTLADMTFQEMDALWEEAKQQGL